jgi:hypothetical protein
MQCAKRRDRAAPHAQPAAALRAAHGLCDVSELVRDDAIAPRRAGSERMAGEQDLAAIGERQGAMGFRDACRRGIVADAHLREVQSEGARHLGRHARDARSEPLRLVRIRIRSALSGRDRHAPETERRT